LCLASKIAIISYLILIISGIILILFEDNLNVLIIIAPIMFVSLISMIISIVINVAKKNNKITKNNYEK
jgi:multisubunit Na+/H+ antiporter MnhG subunit